MKKIKRPRSEREHLAKARREHEAWKRSPKRLAGLRFVRELERIGVPPFALDRYRDLVGSYIGEDLEAVIRFALISWLEQRHARTYARSE